MSRPPPPPLVLLDPNTMLVDPARVSPGATWVSLRHLAHTLLDPARLDRLDRLCASTGAELVLLDAWGDFDERTCRERLRRAGLRAKVRRFVYGRRMSADLRASAARRYLQNVRATRFVVLDAAVASWCWRVYGPVSGSDILDLQTGNSALVTRYQVPPWLQGRAFFEPPAEGLSEAKVAAAREALMESRPIPQDEDASR